MNNHNSISDELLKLHALKEKGVISEREFQEHKAALLEGWRATDSRAPSSAVGQSHGFGFVGNEELRRWLNYVFGFHGRLNRAKFWACVGILIGAQIALIVPLAIMGYFWFSSGEHEGAWLGVFGVFVLIFLAAVFVILLWGHIAVGVKRLHDRNKSGWWLLLFYLLPFVARIGAERGIQDADTAASTAVAVCWFIWAAGSIWALVELGCLPGTLGNNRFGLDPLAPKGGASDGSISRRLGA